MKPLTSVLKTLAILDVLGESSRPLRPTEIAAALGMARGATHQKLVTLLQAGWVEQTEAGAYRLTLSAVRLAGAALDQASLGERIVPALQTLVDQVNETASLAVLDGTTAHIVQRVESQGVLRADLRLGSRMALAGTASGLVLIAFAAPDQVARLQGLGAILPTAEECARVREEGYAISSGRVYEGIRAIAVPVFDARGACVAALSLVAPQVRFDKATLLAPLQASGAVISAMVQGRSE